VIVTLVATAFAAGAGLGYFAVPGASTPFAAAVVSAAALAAAGSALLAPGAGGRRLRWLLPAILALGLLRGVLAVPSAAPLPDELRLLPQVTLEGRLAREPRAFGDSQVLAVEVDRYLADGAWRPARLRVDVFADQLAGASAAGRAPDGFRPGDRLLVRGQLSSPVWSPVASRDSSAVIERPEVTLLGSSRRGPAGALSAVRAGIDRTIDRTAPEPAAGLVKAMVTGSRDGLSTEVRTAFRRSGTSHVLAISGMHIAVFAALATGLAVWLFGKRRQAYLLLPGAAVWSYALLAGFSPPVARAAMMASIYIGARALGRQRGAGPALALTAAAMIAADPSLPGDVSFQLTFLAVAGVVAITPEFQRGGVRAIERLGPQLPAYIRTSLEWVNAGVAMSIGALSMTAPVVALRFDALSAWGTPATMLQVPALPFLIVLGGAQGLLGLVWEPLGVIVGVPATGTAVYVIRVAEAFAALPGGAIKPAAPVLIGAAIYYAAVLAYLGRSRLREMLPGAGIWLGRLALAARDMADQPAPPRRAAPRLVVLAVLAFASAAWAGALSAPPRNLHVTFFETEGGDSILIRTPSGRQVLIDGGDSALGAVRALGSRLPFWDRSLDMVVLTHPHADHSRGLLAVLERFKVDTILDSPSTYDSGVYREWLAAAGNEGARRLAPVPGSWLKLDRDVGLEVLLALPEELAPDPNDRSIVLRLAYGEASFLFTGDLSSVGERRLLGSGHAVRADVLKVGHQGSKGSSSEAFLQALSPSIAVVPASIGNRFGHPHRETLERLRDHVDPERLLVTMDRGTVDIETDGRSYRVRTAR
jgi:competence protein ComEC